MNNDFLSQEEIDALLNNASFEEPAELDSDDKDLLGEIGNICMGSAATTLSVIISQPVSITTPEVKTLTLKQIKDKLGIPNVAIEVRFVSGLSGANLLVLSVPDAGIIADLMMGGTGSHSGSMLSEIELSAVSEAMNQMIGSAATSMATMFKRDINISPPNAVLWDNKTQGLSSVVTDDERIVQISFRLTIGNLVDSQIMLILSLDAAKEIIKAMTGGNQSQETQKKDEAVLPPEQKQEPVAVQKAQFMPLEKGPVDGGTKNIDLILDVPIEISAILGRSRKTIKDILEMGNGSLIELDKLVEEPVEIQVNGKTIAEGEVVVVNENFGIRITNIISSADRVKNLNG